MRFWLSIVMIAFVLFAAGCGGDGGSQGETANSSSQEQTGDVAAAPEANEPKEREIDTTPVMLKFAVHLPVNEEFEKLYIEPVYEKYPHITLEYSRVNTYEKYDELIAAGEIPDLYISFNGRMPGLRDRGLVLDMEEIFEEFGIDVNRFQQNYIDDIKYAAVPEGELYGLPIETGFHALYYNKDIFDNFGVAYPRDGMTMEETLELAKELTRVVDGVQYRGWDIGSIVRLGQPLGLEYVSHDTEMAIMSEGDGWRRVFELGKQIYSIPGNEPGTSDQNRVNGFVNGTIAMLNETNIFSRLKEAQDNGLNWDVAQHPFYPENPNIYGNSTVYMIGAVQTTKHMDQVLLVIETVTSDEVQMEISRAGRVSPLKNEEIRQAFGQGDPYLADKNLPGILKGTPVKYPIYLYREIAEPMVSSKFNEFLKSGADVNTVLRELDQEINLAIEPEKRR